MVELKDFVRNSIVQVLEGVKESHKKADEVGGEVGHGARWDDVHFDISVTTSEKDALEGKVGVLLGTIGLGSGAKSEEQTQSVNRLKFSVPVVFPPSRQGI